MDPGVVPQAGDAVEPAIAQDQPSPMNRDTRAATLASLPWLAAACLASVAPESQADDGIKLQRGHRTLALTEWRHEETEHDAGGTSSAGLYARPRNLVARFAHVSDDRRDVQWVAEIGTARRSSSTLPGAAFRVALGADQRVGHGLWVEWRLGERRRLDGLGTEAAAMVSLRLSPALMR